MHIPSYNAELRPVILHQFIRDNPLGLLTTSIRGPSHPLIQASHIPWVVDGEYESENEFGVLRGHIARPNPQAKAMIEALSQSPGSQHLEEDVLVVFNGPVHHYITPKFYKETKPSIGKVVPTWNYEAVQVYGRAKIYFDTKSPEFGLFLNKQLADLSSNAENAHLQQSSNTEAEPWKVSDAPASYIELLKKNLVGIEIEIKSLAGRFKLSQEKRLGDRNGVIDGLKETGTAAGMEMSTLMARRAAEYDAQKQGNLE
ncbi:uncharacterized protein N7483_001975 [Penicillium malachiteum]|uniref:uncharacterized protein n=1 Tax=Penicillium malachiteum TaxID=1324776 RepID=UPI0025467486|nr:uncharacterized protein N7483_001975 [Penicillium malachiteum]KAJ5736850.1 hypothetical protein N7483_001975 [Penicillium malachiteum]